MKGNRYLAAFKEQHNLVGLSAMVAASMALMNPLPLLVGLVAEAAYLMLVPDSKWYEQRLARRFDSEVAQRREVLRGQIFPQISLAMQERFGRLEAVRRDIDQQSQDDAQWFREILRKLDFLLEKFLHFAAKEAQFHEYLQAARTQAQPGSRPQPPSNAVPSRIIAPPSPALSSSAPAPLSSVPNSQGPLSPRSGRSNGAAGAPANAPANAGASSASVMADAATVWVRETVAIVQASYDGFIAQIEAQAAQATKDDDSVTGAVLEKRLEVLRRRREFVGRIGRVQINLSHQLALVEDTFGLISDELRARPPEQVLADIEDVVSQTNTMTHLLEEIAPLEQLLAA